MITEQKIRLFLSLANTLNFRETANQLFITQQAVSKHISQLENDLGFPLFVRTKRSVRLTAAGERCRALFQEELDRISSFIREEQDTQKRLKKSLRLGYNNWLDLGSAIGTARVRFHAEYPDIAHIPERQPPDLLQQKLRAGELDIILVLRRFITNETDFQITELAVFPMSIIVGNTLVSDNDPRRDIDRLSAFPYIINAFADEAVSETTSRAKREMPSFGLSNKSIQIVPNRDSVYTAVQTGEGIATACAFSNIPEGIAFIPTDVCDTLVAVCMESNKRKLVRKYMDILREEFQAQANTEKK